MNEDKNNSQLSLYQAVIGLIVLFFLGFFGTGCGKLVEIPSDLRTTSDFNFPDKPIDVEVDTNIPEEITFGPDIKGAGEYCDSRYGISTPGSEECFQDYLSYFNINIGLDLDALTNYCKSTYESENAVRECVQDLTNIFDNIGGVGNE